MNEHPILFSGEMIRAILDGRKTQTRRVMSKKFLARMQIAAMAGEVSFFQEEGFLEENDLSYLLEFCPYGQPGDRLWVRETFSINHSMQYSHDHCGTIYRASWEGSKDSYGRTFEKERRWRPSIHMPRWACRILLEVTNIRVERVQDIGKDPRDAWDEGATCSCISPVPQCAGNVEAFKKIWDSINAKRGYSWESNPWVWVIEFKLDIPMMQSTV